MGTKGVFFTLSPTESNYLSATLTKESSIAPSTPETTTTLTPILIPPHDPTDPPTAKPCQVQGHQHRLAPIQAVSIVLLQVPILVLALMHPL